MNEKLADEGKVLKRRMDAFIAGTPEPLDTAAIINADVEQWYRAEFGDAEVPKAQAPANVGELRPAWNRIQHGLSTTYQDGQNNG